MKIETTFIHNFLSPSFPPVTHEKKSDNETAFMKLKKNVYTHSSNTFFKTVILRFVIVKAKYVKEEGK